MKKKIMFLFICCMMLTSCIINRTTYKFIAEPNDFIEIHEENYFRPQQFADNFQEVYRDGNFMNLPSTGEQKILVIPVEFTNYLCTSIKSGCKDSITILHNAFFGNPSSTTWNSVSSYYNKSSYGRLRLTGKVTPWFSLGKSTKELTEMLTKKSKTEITNSILQEAVEWYKTEFDDAADYDQDGDGFIDAVWLVYFADEEEEHKGLFWAYSYWDYLKKPNIESPIGNAYAWANYNFLNISNSNFPDSHVFIHETGHLLGLNDYYSTVSTDVANPVGKLDMMDYGVSDHNALSKLLMGWTRPYVVTDSGKITIGSFEKTGDCIIVPRHWTGKVMDEYLVIEFYTPTGLNEKDAKTKYQNLGNYKKPGIKVFHVDARVGIKRNIYNFVIGYAEDMTEEEIARLDPHYYQIVNTNSSTSYQGNLLLKLFESSGDDTFSEGGSASDETLFHEGDSFGVDTFTDFVFHNGQELEYSFIITALSKNSAEITFSRK